MSPREREALRLAKQSDYVFVNALREVLGMGPLPYTTDTDSAKRPLAHEFRHWVTMRENWEGMANRNGHSAVNWWGV